MNFSWNLKINLQLTDSLTVQSSNQMVPERSTVPIKHDNAVQKLVPRVSRARGFLILRTPKCQDSHDLGLRNNMYRHSNIFKVFCVHEASVWRVPNKEPKSFGCLPSWEFSMHINGHKRILRTHDCNC